MDPATVEAAIEATVRELVGRAKIASKQFRLVSGPASKGLFHGQRIAYMMAARDVRYRMRYELRIHPYDQVTRANPRP